MKKKKPARPTGRQYDSVEDLMKGEGVSREVVQEFRRLELKERAARMKLNEYIEVAQAAGIKVSFGLEDIQMPAQFPNDPEPVRLLNEEAERINKLGNRWMAAKTPNTYAAEMCMKAGWAHALSAAWLRCRLKGEVGPEAIKRDKGKK